MKIAALPALLLLFVVISTIFITFSHALTHISPKDAYALLDQSSENTFLVDVRTDAEWRWVGKPILPQNSSHLIFESLLEFPDMTFNAHFVENVYARLKAMPEFDPSTSNVIFMCCCGNRSVKSADLMSSLIKNTFSMLYGFSGDLNQKSQRMSTNGWVFDKLSWAQV